MIACLDFAGVFKLSSLFLDWTSGPELCLPAQHSLILEAVNCLCLLLVSDARNVQWAIEWFLVDLIIERSVDHQGCLPWVHVVVFFLRRELIIYESKRWLLHLWVIGVHGLRFLYQLVQGEAWGKFILVWFYSHLRIFLVMVLVPFGIVRLGQFQVLGSSWNDQGQLLLLQRFLLSELLSSELLSYVEVWDWLHSFPIGTKLGWAVLHDLLPDIQGFPRGRHWLVPLVLWSIAFRIFGLMLFNLNLWSRMQDVSSEYNLWFFLTIYVVNLRVQSRQPLLRLLDVQPALVDSRP